MKLIIQIPCLNEERTLAATVADLPREVTGFDCVEFLVIDDGSTDRTAQLARELGVHHVLLLGSNRGLATAFKMGVEFAVTQGADVVVNTDGDNQYCAADIAALTRPIVKGEADLVVGCRPIIDHPEFGRIKKGLQMLGSSVLRAISKTTVRDAASGFRAFSREACQRIFIHTKFSYCMETLIQAGNSGLRVTSVDVRVNPKTRDSRLFKSIWQYINKSGGTMLSMFVLYRPGRFFSVLGCFFLAISMVLGLRFVYLVYLAPPEEGRSHLPSLILLALFGMTSVIVFTLGVLGEISKSQRRLAEECVYLQRKILSQEKRRGC
jgi:glycosyltransferase involved in cell wall biosynthesis